MASVNAKEDSPSTPNANSQYASKELDRALVKSLYFRQIEENRETLSTGPPATKPFTRSLLKELAKGLRNGEIQSNTYELRDGLGESDVVLLKRNNTSGMTRKVVAAEDSFEIILGAHIETNHGSLADISSLISQYYSVPRFCIQFLLESCNVCSKGRMPRTETWHLSIASIQRTDACKFGYILYYKDASTNFTLLKPLIKKSKQEITFELFKIFSQFGPPKKLCLYGDELLFVKVLTMLSNYLKLEFPVEYLSTAMIESDLIALVKELSLWVSENRTDDWVIGCHIVQWKMNTTRKTITGSECSKDMTGVPYELMFSSEANVYKYLDNNVI